MFKIISREAGATAVEASCDDLGLACRLLKESRLGWAGYPQNRRPHYHLTKNGVKVDENSDEFLRHYINA